MQESEIEHEQMSEKELKAFCKIKMKELLGPDMARADYHKPIELVEQNEKRNSQGNQQELHFAQNLLVSIQELPKIIKTMQVDSLQALAASISNKAGEEEGKVTCTTASGNYYFVGNGLGEVRIFDLTSANTIDLRHFITEQVFGRRVTCISVSAGMEFLSVGYIDGSLNVWDLRSNQVVTVQEQLHGSEVVSAKVYEIDEASSRLSLISVEADGVVLNSKI